MKLFKTIFISFFFVIQLNLFSQEKPNIVMIVLDDLNDFIMCNERSSSNTDSQY